MNSVLLTVDLTKAVADEAIERKDSVVIAYRTLIPAVCLSFHVRHVDTAYRSHHLQRPQEFDLQRHTTNQPPASCRRGHQRTHTVYVAVVITNTNHPPRSTHLTLPSTLLAAVWEIGWPTSLLARRSILPNSRHLHLLRPTLLPANLSPTTHSTAKRARVEKT